MPVELSIETHGPERGLPVVLLHGFPLQREMWREQVEPLARAGYRVVLPDLRGHGRSPRGEEATMDAMAEDVAVALDARGITSFVLAGFSMGGYVALEMMRRMPERVVGLVLADTRAEADEPEAAAKRRRVAADVRARGAAALAEAMLPNLLGFATQARDPALVEEVRAMILAQDAEAMAQAQEGMAQRRDARPLLPDIHAPTLVLVGAEDRITTPDVARGMRAALPHARLEVVPLAGHLAPLESPDAFNVALLDWLRADVPRPGDARVARRGSVR